MTASTAPYFHTSHLKQRLARDIMDAFLDERISAEEKHWLDALVHKPMPGMQPGDFPRLDQLLINDGEPPTAEMVGVWLISHSSPKDARVYLHSQLYGLERFADRVQLLSSLNERIPPLSGSQRIFEFERVQGAVFDQQMQVIVDQQASQLQRLSQHLQQLPSLRTAMRHALQQQCIQTLADTCVEVDTSRVHLLKAEPQHGGMARTCIVRVQTLLEAMADVLTGVVVPAGQTRAFLNADGKIEDATQTLRYETVLADAVRELRTGYESLLSDYWLRTRFKGQTGRKCIADALAESLRQHLLAQRQDGSLSAIEFRRLATLLQPSLARAAGNEPSESKRLLVVGTDQQTLKLVGPLLIDLNSADMPGLMLYTPFSGVRRYPTLQAVSHYFSSEAGRAELKCYLSLNDLALLPATDALQLKSYALEHSVTDERVDAVIALQQRNLQFVLNRNLSSFSEAAALIDDALDVRRLIDGRLIHMDGGRWQNGGWPFFRQWATRVGAPVASTPVTRLDHPPTDIGAFSSQLDDSWLAQLSSIDRRVVSLLDARPDIETHARHALNDCLAVLFETPPDASGVWVQWGIAATGGTAAQPSKAIPALQQLRLTDLVFEQLSGYRRAPLPDNAVALHATASGQLMPLAWLRADLLNPLLQRVTAGFLEGYLQRVSQFYTQPLRRADMQFDAGKLAEHIHLDVLQLGGKLAERLDRIDPQRLTMLTQVLDFPDRSLRVANGDAMTEVYSLLLFHDPAQPAAAMVHAFLLQQPAHPQRGVVFWSSPGGVQTAASVEEVATRITASLASARTREPWLALLAEQDKTLLRRWLEQPDNPAPTLSVHRVDEHFLCALQHAERDRHLKDVRYAFEQASRCPMPAAVLRSYLERVQADEFVLPTLDRMASTVQATLFKTRLPDWLRDASVEEQYAFARILHRYYLATQLTAGFFSGIPLLKTFAREQLLKQLKIDFPDRLLEPDQIGITVTRYVPALVPLGEIPSSLAAATQVDEETLTDFALNHFFQIQGATLSVVLPPDTPAPDPLSPRYFHTLIRTLDVGRRYQEVIENTLNETNPDYATRRQRFVEQLPSCLLLAAQQLKLQQQLSAMGYDFLENLMEMPDNLARQPVHGQDIVLRPLQLIPAAGMSPDTAAGMYVLGPLDVSQGPVLLHTLFNERYSLKEYASQAALLEDLRQTPELQTLVLDRLGPPLRTRYDNNGFTEAHIPFSTEGLFDVPLSQPGPVTLADAPYQGNVLQWLFEETVKAFKTISRQQSVTTAEADWRSFVHIMSLGVDQVLAFLPGKLGLLIAAWQSQPLFKASANAAYDQHWGKALSELSAALGMLVSSGHGLEESSPEGGNPAPGNGEQGSSEGASTVNDVHESAPLVEFSWRNSVLAPELKARLRAFEARDIVLGNLQKDELYNLYQNPATLKKYAAVAGQVYQVEAVSGSWFIVGERGRGPRVKLNHLQRWALDLDWGLRGGGSLPSRFRTVAADVDVERILVVEARGIKEIRRRFRDRAYMINEGRQQAIRYVEDSLFNLSPANSSARLSTEALQLIADFFGVPTPDDVLLAAVRKTLSQLYVGIIDPSLSLYSSKRYVVGSNRPGYESTMAFVMKTDPKRRIYLTERFFQVPPFRLKSESVMRHRFDVGAHYRAASLIHELAHQVNQAHDIAYVESSAPFPDLLADPVGPEDTFKAELARLQTRSLSHRTDPGELFVTFDKTLWRDLNDWDGEGKQAVLQITGQPTLELARAVFLNDARKRSEVILKNADSIALLVVTLGRRRFN